MSDGFLLLIYCLLIALFSLAGGYLPALVKMTHTRTQLAMSFVSGLMLGVAFYHLLPHSVAMAEGDYGLDRAVWWLMLGLIAMLLMLRMFHFHQHEFSSVEGHHHHHGEQVTHVHHLSWIGIALGLGLHTLVDGIALGATMLGGTQGDVGMIGLGVFLAIALHKPLDAMSITSLMEVGGWGARSRWGVNLLFAIMCPLGALLFYYGVNLLGSGGDQLVSAALAFAAGAFVCIALSDLLPEVHFHSHDRAKLTLVFILGIGLAYAIGSVEPASLHTAPH